MTEAFGARSTTEDVLAGVRPQRQAHSGDRRFGGIGVERRGRSRRMALR